MNILYISPYDPAPWQRQIEQLLPQARFRVWAEGAADAAADVDYILCWKPEPGLLARFPGARAIFNLGAGVDALLQDPALPSTVPIFRLVDPVLTAGMVEYVVHWVLHFHRDFHGYARRQRQGLWQEHAPPFTARRGVGFLGLGQLAGASARALQALGFANIAAWSRRAKAHPGIESFAGDPELKSFLARTEILVTLLPLTPATSGIVNTQTLACLADGACVINPGRGALIDDDALLQALNSGKVQAAALDTFATEPLPAEHPYWTHPRVFMTPHIASITVAGAAAGGIVAGIQKIEAGEMPDNVVDLQHGY